MAATSEDAQPSGASSAPLTAAPHHCRPTLRGHVNRFWRCLQWNLAGRPKDRPMVIRPGSLEICPHDHKMIRDWHFVLWYVQPRYMTADHLWEALSARYPVHPTPRPAWCSDCQAI